MISFVVFLTGLAVVFSAGSIFLLVAGIFLIVCGFGTIEAVFTELLDDYNPESVNQVTNISQMFFSMGAVSGQGCHLAASCAGACIACHIGRISYTG